MFNYDAPHNYPYPKYIFFMHGYFKCGDTIGFTRHGKREMIDKLNWNSGFNN